MKYLLPRGYLSYSQLMLWERSPKEYERIYIKGEDYPVNQYMKLGSKVAAQLEKGVEVGDRLIEQFRVLTPAYKRREHKITAKGEFTLLGILDACDIGRKCRLGEYKTGKKFTQKMTDDSDQITFYNMLLYLTRGKLFDENYIHWAETKLNENKIELTGNITTFATKRTIFNVLALYSRCRKAIKEIDKLMNKII